MARRNRGSASPPPAPFRSPARAALAIHGLAWLAAAPLLLLGVPLPGTCAAQGAVALLLSWRRRLPWWWRVINAAFFPLVALSRRQEIHPGWYLAALALLAATSLGSLRTRVPLYLSSGAAVDEVLRRLPDRAGLRVIDLGCGLGGWLVALRKRRPDLQVAGVEMAPLNWLVSRLRLAGRGEVRLGSIWDADLSRYDVVYAYLSPAAMPRLWEKVRQEMRPGSLFISNSFGVPGVPPDEVVELNDVSRAKLLVWRR